MALTIHGFAQSNFVRSVRMIAEERGIEYEHNAIFPLSKEARGLHPLGQVPVIDHDDFRLYESIAIAEYLDAAFDGPSLLPTDPKEAAQVRQWMSFSVTTVDQFFMRRYVVEYAFNKDEDGNTVRTLIDMAVGRFKYLFRALEEAVAPGYLGSSEFTMADCFFAPILAAASNFPEAQEYLSNSPNLQAYLQRMNERDSFKNTAT